MNNITRLPTYYYQHTYYRFGEYYSRYYAAGLWKDSGKFTNEHIALHGVEIKNRGLK
jgi:hypothetical protein